MTDFSLLYIIPILRRCSNLRLGISSAFELIMNTLERKLSSLLVTDLLLKDLDRVWSIDLSSNGMLMIIKYSLLQS